MRDEYRLDLNRRRIYYLERGEGETVVLLHGNGADAALYRPLIEAIAGQYRVLVPDLPGYGRSQARYPLLPERYFDELEAFILQQVKGPFALIGHSLGGLIAYCLQQRGKLPISRMVWMEAAIFDLDWRLRMILPGYGLWHGFQPHSREVIEARMRELSWDYDRGNLVSAEAFLRSYLASDNAVQGMFLSHAPSLLPYRFEQIEMPVLCLRGEKDTFVSRATDFFAPRLPQSRYQVIPQAAHFLIDENNEALNQAILGFLAETALAADLPATA